jgi:hypothetical protein
MVAPITSMIYIVVEPLGELGGAKLPLDENLGSATRNTYRKKLRFTTIKIKNINNSKFTDYK